jgi:two-component system sensor histidine kinase VanS
VNRLKNSLSTKIFFGIAASLLAACLLIFVLLQNVMPRTYEHRLHAELITNLSELVLELERTPQAQWEPLLLAFTMENGASVNIREHTDIGEIPGQTTTLSIGIFTYPHTQDAAPSAWGAATSVAFAQDFYSEGTRYIITVFGEAVARNVAQLSAIFADIFPYVLLLILLISLVAAFVYSRFLAKPIVQISGISKKIANLELTERCNTSRSDEIGVLANNLNEMAEKLSGSMDELQRANEQLQADIEKEREHERRRRDFFSAISHELKTPVTILKGELDGMILNVGKFKDRDKYLQEAYKTSESIEKLVRDIMTLAKLDTINLQPQTFELSNITDALITTYEPIAQSKQIKINRRYDESTSTQADKTQIEMVISNIIGNAVKHSPENSEVDIDITKGDDNVSLSVQNSGVQIAPDELKKLWEPFYRIDKSRSRDTGGSGLGLYIVKTILDLHGFSYKMESTEAGVKITICFK